MIEPSKAIEATRTPQMGSSGKKEAKILYIQMEYCTTKTLRKVRLESICPALALTSTFRLSTRASRTRTTSGDFSVKSSKV
jgi:hypothetical protein